MGRLRPDASPETIEEALAAIVALAPDGCLDLKVGVEHLSRMRRAHPLPASWPAWCSSPGTWHAFPAAWAPREERGRRWIGSRTA
jgi:hypothetical protein